MNYPIAVIITIKYCRVYVIKIIASRNFGEVIPVIFVNILATSLVTIKMLRILL